ncbi:DEAD/DEAH box helicase [Blastococcus sp. LR1]|uniref:DEAD/DEAH box helicase n=1 Tax=Blastococcus sp. LR1 TaxID=2877000 RepID=UPI001CCF1F1E|nr:DEAD/DEAH box helicase [Blastococcus sp. LR1]MCA0147128.1 DEAD/DEAH box helicase [Blastococcus sp. LR1]
MLGDWREMVTDAALADAVGADVLDRARPYAARSVLDVRLTEDGRRLTGFVQGGAPTPYRTTVVRTDGGRVGWAAACTCPVGDDCKHAVAVLLHLQSDIQRAAGGSRLQRAATRTWEQELAELVSAADRSAPATVPVALQFELVEPEPGRSRPSIAAPGSRQRLVRLRPVVPGKRGQWVRSGISWRQLQYDNSRAGWDPAHVAAMRALHATHQAARNQFYSYAPVDVYLHEFGPGLWRLLAEAVADGVPLVTADRTPRPVVLAPDGADVAVDLRADGGSTELSAVLRIDGRAVDPGALSFLGMPPHGVTVDGPPRDQGPESAPGLVLARLGSPVPPPLAGLVARGGGITIPADDVDRFLRDWYPGLRQAVPVISADGSVELPEVLPPALATEVRYPGDATVCVVWSVRYGPDREFALHAPGGAGDGRDPVAEQQLVEALPRSVGGLPELWTPEGRLAGSVELSGLEALEFTTEVLPALRGDPAVDVTVVGTPTDYRQSTSAPRISFAARDTGESDWFDLGVSVSIDGQTVPFETLYKALAAGRTRLALISGTWFSLQRPEFEQLRLLIEEARDLRDVPGDGVQVSRFSAGLWEQLLGLGVVEEQSERWTREVRGLIDAEHAEPPPVPAGLAAELRPYQHEGYGWLAFLWDHRLGGVLADDMGLGKTLQTLALLARAHEAGDLDEAPVLVVAPTSVVSTWAREAARFAPGLQVAVVDETERKAGTALHRRIAGAHVVVTSYALFRIDEDAWTSQPWRALVLDEAQFVKNHQARTYACARRLPAPVKLALTGTPLENSVMDLWALMSIVAPGLFPDPGRFTEHYRIPIERDGDAEKLATLRRRIRPLVRRRTKEMVAAELPPKQEQVLEVVLNPRHEKLYQTHLQRERSKVLGLVEDMSKNRMTIFRSLTLLRQLSLDPVLVDPAYGDVRASKTDAFLEHLREVVAEGHRVLVFSQFTRYLGSIRDRLTAEGIDWVYLDGRTRDRDARVQEFRTGSAPVFLISLKAGGFGLTLTEADYVFVLDPWWNPASEAQAVDRAHRIGQDKTVIVYRLVAVGTIEEKVMELKARKQALFSRVVDDGALASGALTADDVRGLFG